MSGVTENTVLEALRHITGEGMQEDIVSSGMVSGVRISDSGQVVFMITVDPSKGGELEGLRQRAEKAVYALEGVSKVSAVLTAERKKPNLANKSISSPGGGAQHDPHGMARNPRLKLPIKNIVVVASGKGGVGKSTLATNLAISLANNSQNEELSVGLLDADIYGPSIPMMMGDEDYRPDLNAQRKIIPLVKNNLKVMSIGFMMEKKNEALVWRGPMIQTALYQMLRDVDWTVDDGKGGKRDLDVLIIDLPPGTGDVQLTLAQKVDVSGAVIVSTPQDIALIDARKAVAMFKKTGVAVLGLVENMSMYVCPKCGNEDHIFGKGGAKEEAEALGVPFLGGVPLTADIRLQSDSGTPIIVAQPDGQAARCYRDIAKTLKGVLA